MSRVRFGHVVLAYLALVLVLGGASGAGFLTAALLQVLAGALIAWSVLHPTPNEPPCFSSEWRRFLIAFAILACVQFVPLPPHIWAHLPGREAVAQGFRLLGQPLPWLTLSLSPWGSLASLAWWLPALALIIVMQRPDRPSPRLIARMITVLAVIAMAISGIQRTSGSLYFYSVTNYGMGVGFFANANNQAMLLLCTIALRAGAAAIEQGRPPREGQVHVQRVAFFSITMLLIIGILLSGSLAGIGLLIPVLAGSALLFRSQARNQRVIAVVGAIVLAAAIVAYTLFATADLGSAAQPGGSRLDFLRNSLPLMGKFFPFGSGLGTFEQVYHWRENPQIVGPVYLNHAHNEYVEVLLETGVFGFAAMFLFGWFWVAAVRSAVAGPNANPMTRAAALMTGVLLLHSLVEFPLRTPALSCVMALGCAWLLRPVRASIDRRAHQAEWSARSLVHI